MQGTEVGLHCQYYDGLESLAANASPLVLLSFDRRANLTTNSNTPPVLSTGLLPLSGAMDGSKIISGELIAVQDTQAEANWSSNYFLAKTEQCLLIAFWINEKDAHNLVEITEQLYSDLLERINAAGYPYLVRIWNYFAQINAEENGMERYRQFCLGRFNAFEKCGLNENQYPSACALGHGGGDLLVYALASKIPPRHFENPRQASAYHYPREYGPRSPSFARASLLNLPGQAPKLFVSGTASVVGFTTQHPYDLAGQIAVTLENLASLLAAVIADQAATTDVAPTLQGEVIKVYVRRPEDLSLIETSVEQAYPDVPTIYVMADICRADLLLEIDGIWNLLR